MQFWRLLFFSQKKKKFCHLYYLEICDANKIVISPEMKEGHLLLKMNQWRIYGGGGGGGLGGLTPPPPWAAK